MFLLGFLKYYVFGFALIIAVCGIQAGYCALKKVDYDTVFNWQCAMVGYMVFKLIGEKLFDKLNAFGESVFADKKTGTIWAFISALWWPLQAVLVIGTFPVALYAIRKHEDIND